MRCIYSMINEGAKILAERVAAKPVEIDMVWLHGDGFPAWRGGGSYALCTMCIGVGQGVALIIERV